MSPSRWVQIPVEPWSDPSGGTRNEVYLAFEPLLPQDDDDTPLRPVRAWVRLALVYAMRGDLLQGAYPHVDVGTDWRRLLNARLHAFPGQPSALYYEEGRAVKLERPSVTLPSLPEHLVSALRDQWLKDYGEELGP